MSRSFITAPDGSLIDAELSSIAGASVKRQSVEAVPPRTLISAVLTRPADTAVYAAGDAIANSTTAPVVNTFASMARFNGGSGIIKSAMLLDSGNQATKLSAELWLFRGASPGPTPDNDNALFTPTDAELANLIGPGPIVFDGPTAGWVFVGDAGAGAAGNVIIAGRLGPSGAGAHVLDMPYICDPTLSSLYGLLVARNAYTPLSAEVFTLILGIERE